MTPKELREWRDRLGFTQAELAAALFVDVRQVARWEAGDSKLTATRLTQLEALAKRRKVPLPA